MIVEFDGYDKQELVFGKSHSIEELRMMYFSIRLVGLSEGNLVDLFCRKFSFEAYPYDSKIQVDMVIDTDTDRIYRPRY
ncbi:MAG: hypothetical protein RR651_10745 [Lysinibacillus sp.]